MKTISLFAGIGGIDLGLESMGYETVAFSEFDPKIAKKKNGRQYAAEVMAARFPAAAQLGDISTLTFRRNREGVPGILRWHGETSPDQKFDVLYKGAVDVIVGGFPCQDISLAGKQAGIEEGTRSGLWRYFFEAIDGLRPRGVIIENVAALCGKGLDRVLRDLHRAGYDAEWDVIGAAGVGAPHLRERIFIVAWPHGEGDHGEWVEPPVFDSWIEEPELPRLTTDDVDQRPARLRCLGNAVVPQVAAWVGAILSYRIDPTRPNYGVDPSTWDAKWSRGDRKGMSKFCGVAFETGDGRPYIAGMKLPRAGRMTSGEVFERKRSCTQAHAKAVGLKYMAATLRPRVEAPGTHTSDGLLTTPTASDARDGVRAEGFAQGGTSLPTQASRLIPTPTAKDADSSRNASAIRETSSGNPGETLTDYVDPTNGGRIAAQHAIECHEHEECRGRQDKPGDPACLHAKAKLLPTPKATDWKGPGPLDRRPECDDSLSERVVRLLPTPQAADGDRTSPTMVRGNDTLSGAATKLLPTPTAMDGTSGPGTAATQQGSSNLRTEAALLPTPRACAGLRSSGLNRSELMDALAASEPADSLIPTPRASEWKGTGPLGSKSHDYRVEKGYLDATVQEIEQQTGRLNPEWVTWLMGFPANWTII